jgi:hypothetical protein
MSNKELQAEQKQEVDSTNQERDDLRKVLSTPEGQRLIWRLFEFSGIYRNAYSGNTNSTDYNCGMQAVGQFLLDEAIDANPQAVSAIIIKNKTKK